MKVNNVIGISASRMENGAKPNEAVQVKNGSVNVSQLNMFQDDIANRKQKAMQDAMKFVRDQFKADGRIDATIESCRTRSEESQESIKEAQKELAALEGEKQQALSGCEEGSEEYKTIEKEYEKRKQPWTAQKESAQKDIMVQTKTIDSIKQEILKYNGMTDAGKAKDMVLEAASKEAAGMLIEEAREKVEEDLKETVDKAQEQKEEKEEEKARLEEIQAEQKKRAQDAEERAETNHNNAKRSASAGVDLDELNQKYKAIIENTEKIAAEQKLLMEELKGISVNTVL